MRINELTLTATAALGIIAGSLGGVAVSQSHVTAEPADVTVAPCSAFEASAHPHFDGPIMPDVCVSSSGKVVPIVDPDFSGIDHCKSDDWNDGSQDLCWTRRVTDKKVLIIDSTDTVVSTSAE
jgi:hypothetical protein